MLHHIFDFLDAETLLLVLRRVCKDFCCSVNSYSRYQLDFTNTNKFRLQSICRLIDPARVVSLTLEDGPHTPGQIPLFLSLFEIRHFIRIHKLTVREIASVDLFIILADLPVSTLRSLFISRQRYTRLGKESPNTCLDGFLRRTTLHSLDLTIWYEVMKPLSWSNQQHLQRITLRHSVTSGHYCDLLRYLPLLRICVLDNLRMEEDIDGMDGTPVCHSMVTLTLNSRFMKMDELERLLPFTPSVVHLRLMGKANLDDGLFDADRWEALIRTKLSLLQRLEFDVVSTMYISVASDKLQSILQPYRTSFWLEEKRWLFACTYIEDGPLLRLYSTPPFRQHVEYHPREMFVSTLSDVSSMRNYVTQLSLKVTDLTADVSCIRDRPLFPQVTQLQCYWDWALSIRTLQSFVNLSRLTRMSLRFDFHQMAQPTTINILTELFTLVPDLQSLSLVDQWPLDHPTSFVQHLYSMLPSQVQHLHTNLHSNHDHLRTLLIRLPSLFSLTIDSSNVHDRFTSINNCLREEKIDFTSRIGISSLYLWFGRSF